MLVEAASPDIYKDRNESLESKKIRKLNTNVRLLNSTRNDKNIKWKNKQKSGG